MFEAYIILEEVIKHGKVPEDAKDDLNEVMRLMMEDFSDQDYRLLSLRYDQNR